MRSHPRIRRIIKWTSVLLCTLILFGCYPSGWFILWYSPGMSFSGSIGNGDVTLCWQPGLAPIQNNQRPGVFIRRYGSDRITMMMWRDGVWLPYYKKSPPVNGSPPPQIGQRDCFRIKARPGLEVISIPLWLMFLSFAVPTAILFHRDRRFRKPGHCRRCGYNLTGNTSGICSECGTKRPADESPATAE